MNVIKRSNAFQFYEKRFLDHQVSGVVADDNIIVSNNDGVLLKDYQAGLPQFVCHSIFINFLEKP